MPRRPPKKSRPRKASRRSVAFYVRIDRDLHGRILRLADERGYPHSLSSVASEALARGMDAIAPVEAIEKEQATDHA